MQRIKHMHKFWFGESKKFALLLQLEKLIPEWIIQIFVTLGSGYFLRVSTRWTVVYIFDMLGQLTNQSRHHPRIHCKMIK